jgi:hypothetical protein
MTTSFYPIDDLGEPRAPIRPLRIAGAAQEDHLVRVR